jgi:hypothetical protein
MRDETWGSKTLEEQAQGALPQVAREKGKSQVCKAVGAPVLVCSNIAVAVPGDSRRECRSQSWPSRPVGGLTRHGGCPARAKHRAMHRRGIPGGRPL